ncbi:metallophosphoesterase [Lactobacillaceae bacterium L1_55_11]|nr:metallophosphoesterase [Lactobacillaceae bacterium L1_55_11]
MKVAFSSDNHFDINHLDVDEIMPLQARYLVEQGVEAYIITGDAFNDFGKTLKYAHDLQNELGDGVKVRFIAGNHEMGAGVTYDELESDLDPLYFHNKALDVGDDGVRIIGNNGWYDYSFVGDDYPESEIIRFKREFWYDRRIEQPMSDPERFARNLRQIRDHLELAGDRKTVLVNHFVPRLDYIHRMPRGDSRLDILNAFLGSEKLGETVDQSYTIATVFGHLHLHPAPLKVGNNNYYNVAVGYHTARVNEWGGNDFMSEWIEHLLILDL